MDRGAWWATVHGVTKSQTWLKWFSGFLTPMIHSRKLLKWKGKGICGNPSIIDKGCGCGLSHIWSLSFLGIDPKTLGMSWMMGVYFVIHKKPLLFNMLSRVVIDFLPRSKRLLISGLPSPSAVILECKDIVISPSICHEEMGIPEHLTCLLRNLYAGHEATVRTGHEKTDWFQIRKEYIKAVYCHPAYLTFMQSTSCELHGWMKHKLKSRLLGEISIASDMQMTPPLWQKAKKN